MVLVSYRNSYGKVLKNEWVQVGPPPCAQTGVKSSLGTSSVFKQHQSLNTVEEMFPKLTR